MILLAALVVAVAAAMVLLGVSLGGLGWLYGAIGTATVALAVLALGVVRELRHRPAPDGCPPAPDGCPPAPDGCPPAPDGCPPAPDGDDTSATGVDRNDADLPPP